jgi:hypothetical protein
MKSKKKFLSSKLINEHNFVHGVDFYGSYLAIKNDFVINVYDDIEYLLKNEFFQKNKNVLFKIDENELCLFQNIEKKILQIHDISFKSELSVKSMISLNASDNCDNKLSSDFDLCDVTNLDNIHDFGDKINMPYNSSINSMTLNSDSWCSSRSSHTSVNSDDNTISTDSDDETQAEKVDADEDENEDESEYDDSDEIEVNITIPKFPVQVISMEYCEDTLDNLILEDNLSNDEWYSILMQIIMILITYQKAFEFTHNDLHTNNVMYVQTNRKYIYYKYKNKQYRVPTFGRIMKIIDFGRSIYKFNGKVFCSDSYKNGGDAASLYNIEPYLNKKKPILEPNFSFDLCRLACAIFDFIVDDVENMQNKIDGPIQKLIYEWCLDDNGLHMLYKTNGQDRYPEFKLYKMIARCVHNHTADAQLLRPEFMQFEFNEKAKNINIINIDDIHSYAN